MKQPAQQSHKKASLLILGLLSLCVSGCVNPRIVLVPPGEVIKVGPDVKGKVYVNTDDGWQLSQNKVTIPEGWYALPPEND